MRLLFIAALLALSTLLHTVPAYAAASYYLDVSDAYFTSTDEACKSLSFDPVVYSGETYSVTAQTEIGSVSYHGSYFTCSLRLYAPSGNYQNVQGEVGGVLAKITTKSCEAGTDDYLTWPLGREEVAIGDPSFVRFNFPVPQTYCINGCNGTLDSTPTNDFFGEPDSDPKYEIIYANVTYNLDGSACSSGGNPPTPDIPPPPTDNPDPCETNPAAEGCSGGGDPGGGDPGGGDPGGGDPGGGDPGGGDPGGGDPGGGDPGGGDPGGGDPGGGNEAGGLACDQPLNCVGDSIACAQLIFLKEQKCSGDAATDFLGQKDDIADFLDQPAFDAEEDEEINMGEMFSEGTRFLPSSCPPAKSISLSTGGGRTFQLSFEPLCQLASDLSYLIVAAAAVFYALYVGRAVGGE